MCKSTICVSKNVLKNGALIEKDILKKEVKVNSCKKFMTNLFFQKYVSLCIIIYKFFQFEDILLQIMPHLKKEYFLFEFLDLRIYI